MDLHLEEGFAYIIDGQLVIAFFSNKDQTNGLRLSRAVQAYHLLVLRGMRYILGSFSTPEKPIHVLHSIETSSIF